MLHVELFPPGGRRGNDICHFFFPPHQRPYPFTSIDLTCPLSCARPENVIFKSGRRIEDVRGSGKRNVTHG